MDLDFVLSREMHSYHFERPVVVLDGEFYRHAEVIEVKAIKIASLVEREQYFDGAREGVVALALELLFVGIVVLDLAEAVKVLRRLLIRLLLEPITALPHVITVHVFKAGAKLIQLGHDIEILFGLRHNLPLTLFVALLSDVDEGHKVKDEVVELIELVEHFVEAAVDESVVLVNAIAVVLHAFKRVRFRHGLEHVRAAYVLVY